MKRSWYGCSDKSCDNYLSCILAYGFFHQQLEEITLTSNNTNPGVKIVLREAGLSYNM